MFKKGHTPWNSGKKGLKTGPLGQHWKLSEETKKKMSIWQKGHKSLMWGKHLSEETKRKIGEASKGNKYNLGKKASEETKRKMSKVQTGRKHSEESKRKMSESSKGKKFSEEHKKKISQNNARYWLGKQFGEKNHNWKGGISPENIKIRQSKKGREWIKFVFIRDDYTDQKYKERGGKLVAHHINNFADFPELRFVIDNGVTLSKKAHKEFHRKYGNKNNTREQLEEFLQS